MFMTFIKQAYRHHSQKTSRFVLIELARLKTGGSAVYMQEYEVEIILYFLVVQVLTQI